MLYENRFIGKIAKIFCHTSGREKKGKLIQNKQNNSYRTNSKDGHKLDSRNCLQNVQKIFKCINMVFPKIYTEYMLHMNSTSDIHIMLIWTERTISVLFIS